MPLWAAVIGGFVIISFLLSVAWQARQHTMTEWA
jgi:hypothetical protein